MNEPKHLLNIINLNMIYFGIKYAPLMVSITHTLVHTGLKWINSISVHGGGGRTWLFS